ncbi:MAG: 4Fe-4S binding protein [Anaerobutyricum hallii]
MSIKKLCCLRVCENTCPLAAVKVHRGCYAVVEETLCVGCGKCARSCPVGCIEMKERVAV